MFRSLVQSFKRSRRVRQDGSRTRKIQARPKLEVLEERFAPAIYNVTGLADGLAAVVQTAPGVFNAPTLRSAIQAANANPGGNTINLTVSGTYSLTLRGTPGEVDNLAGELAINSSGGDLTINNTSGGFAAVNGNHLNRVFDVNPIFGVGSAVVTNGGSGFTSAPMVTLTGGGGTGATATAQIANGMVTGITITSTGSGYTSPPTISFSGGGGSGAAATAILNGPHITVTMIGFTIENGLALGDGPDGTGGGIRDTNNASLVLTNMVLTHNTANTDGGGVAMEDLLSTPWAIVLNNTTVSFNHAGDQGGGIDTDGTGLDQINAGSVITGNTSANEGAGIYLDATEQGGVFQVDVANGGSGFTSAPTVLFSGGGGTGAAGTAVLGTGAHAGQVVAVLITNPGSGYIAPPSISFSGGGGSGATATATLTSQTATLKVTGALITNNVSTNSIGGGIANSGNGVVTIAGSTIAGNVAGTTGGGFADKNQQGTLNVINSLFRGNRAAGDGGAIFVASPNTTITSTEVVGNSSGGDGGGVFAGGVKLTVQASTIAGNFTSGNGAGIEIETSGSGLANGSVITNSTITDNTALSADSQTQGGGIDAANGFSGELELLNDTVNANFASTGGGVFFAGTSGAVIVQNTILAGNVAGTTSAGPDAANPAGSFTDLGGNLIGVSGTGGGNTGFTAPSTQKGTVANPLDPLLGPLQNNGGPTVGSAGHSITLETETLLPASKAIDKGIVGGPTVDERGFARADTTGGVPPDIGAFEFQGAVLQVALTASASKMSVGGSVKFTITVHNTSSNSLPDDNTTVTVTLPSNLTITSAPPAATIHGNVVTFRLGALAGNSQLMFAVGAKVNAGGPATVTATVTSPDSNPNTVSASTTVNALTKHSMFPGFLSLFGLGSR